MTKDEAEKSSDDFNKFLFEEEQEKRQKEQGPWLDIHLTKEAVNYLWDIINAPLAQQTNMQNNLAGNISKSEYILDKGAWFYENVLKQHTETMYFKDWNNYYDFIVA